MSSKSIRLGSGYTLHIYPGANSITSDGYVIYLFNENIDKGRYLGLKIVRELVLDSINRAIAEIDQQAPKLTAIDLLEYQLKHG